MLFLLEKQKNGTYSTDNYILKNLIENSNEFHEIIRFELDDFYYNGKLLGKESYPKAYRDAIPIGDIPFVEAFYKIFYGIKREYPIEIPEALQKDKFLKRKYKIVSGKDLPRTGKYFIKDVSALKTFSFLGRMDFLITDEIFEKPKNKFDNTLYLNKEHLYQVSEPVEILSEYRIIAIDGKLYNISHYDGDPSMLPDIELIEDAIKTWYESPNSPKSFSFDVAVTPRGSIILEAHLISSLGIYSNALDENFLYAYLDTKEYLLKHNHQVAKFDNFDTFKLEMPKQKLKNNDNLNIEMR